MKMPGMSLEELNRIKRIDRTLSVAFKVGLPLGVGFFVLGTIVAGLYDPVKFRNELSPKVAAVAETVMALACLAMATKFFLEGYVFVRGFAKSTRSVVNGIVANALAGIVILGGAVVLGVFAIRDWLR